MDEDITPEEDRFFKICVLILGWLVVIPFLIVLLYDYIKESKTR